jgi:hypothetical protein
MSCLRCHSAGDCMGGWFGAAGGAVWAQVNRGEDIARNASAVHRLIIGIPQLCRLVAMLNNV